MRKRKTEAAGRQRLSKRFQAWLHTAGAKCVGILILGGLLIALVLCLVCAPERYSLTVGTISRVTINASKDVVDENATQEARRAAANSVEPTYHLEEGVSDEVLGRLDSVFSQLRTVQQYGLTLREEGDSDESIRTRSFSDAELEYAQSLVDTYTLSRYQATTILRTSTADFETMVSTVTTAVGNSLNTGIREGRVNDAISTIQQIVGYRVDISLVQNVLPGVLRYCLAPNLVIDEVATQAARNKAMEGVESVMYLQGQNIIREGEVVTQNQYDVIKSLGLLVNDQYDWNVYLGCVLTASLAMVMLTLLLHLCAPGILHDPRKTSVLIAVQVVSVGLAAVAIKAFPVFLAPLALASILATVLLGWNAAVPATVSMCVIMASITAGDRDTTQAQMLYLTLMTLVGGCFSVRFLDRKPQRMSVMLCGVLVGLFNVLILLAMTQLTALDTSSMIQNGMYALAGGVICGLIAVGLQPLFEAIFNLATASKLLELANPNHPLLRRLLLEAPGTYHHAIIVANLAEAAAEKIGANPLLARTGAYFHDVGKLKRPQYFKENQVGDNPLNITDPYVSAAIITSHTGDGFQLAQKYRLPKEVQQIILEHHGDTPVMYFYHKALQMADGQTVDIADFRYAGPRPASKEAAIVMLADTIEAAIRSMPDPTPEKIREGIERLVRGKREDGQLSNSPLSLKDIDGICEAFAKVLNGVFHERIEYPTTEVPKRGAFLTQEAAREEKGEQAKAEPAAEKPGQPAPEAAASAESVQVPTVQNPAAEPVPAAEKEDSREADLGA